VTDVKHSLWSISLSKLYFPDSDKSGLIIHWSLPSTCAFLLIGSNKNGDLCPPCGPLVGIFGGSILSKSTSFAMAFKKFSA
jgi:hypothetical protein